MFFTFHFSLFASYAQDDKGTMFNPVDHAVVSQTIAPMPARQVWAMWVWLLIRM